MAWKGRVMKDSKNIFRCTGCWWVVRSDFLAVAISVTPTFSYKFEHLRKQTNCHIQVDSNNRVVEEKNENSCTFVELLEQ